MTKIFISYRREDSAGITGRIYEHLEAHFGADALFIDEDSIPFGLDFREHITHAVNQCDVMLAVIGRNWVGGTAGARRIDDPRDFVRIELEVALERKLPVIPILIVPTPMPREADLPPSLGPFAYRNAIDIDQGRDFRHHVDRLIRGIEHLFERAKRASVPPSSEPAKPVGPIPSPPPAEPGPGAAVPRKEWTNTIGMELVRIESGEFPMGSTGADPEATHDEKPQHRVRISKAFFLGIHEVTQGQYQAVMGKNPSMFKGPDDLPVEQVSWLDAVHFCNTLSEREQRTPYYRINGKEVTIAGGNGYRLPTEAEWEYACRAGSATVYPLGDDRRSLGEYAWYNDNSGEKTHPVGRKRPNAWGLYDMLGNVWEWCSDWYDQEYYASSPPADPPGASQASHRVFRGGGWDGSAGGCRPAYRGGSAPEYRFRSLGFRVAAVQE